MESVCNALYSVTLSSSSCTGLKGQELDSWPLLPGATFLRRESLALAPKSPYSSSSCASSSSRYEARACASSSSISLVFQSDGEDQDSALPCCDKVFFCAAKTNGRCSCQKSFHPRSNGPGASGPPFNAGHVVSSSCAVAKNRELVGHL